MYVCMYVCMYVTNNTTRRQMIYFCSKKAAQKDKSCFLLNYKLKESLRSLSLHFF